MSDNKRASVTHIGDEMIELSAIPKRSSHRVLIVDDDAYSLELLSKMLQSFGIENISYAKDGREAWNEIRKALKVHKPHTLILSDWNMPTSDGMQLLLKIRGHQETHTLPMILLTGRLRRADVEEAIQSKVNDYIAKPVDAKTLREKIEKLIGPLETASDK